MIYISGGKYKKRKIEVETNIVRPTSSSKRESIFSILESFAIKSSLEIYNNKCFVDLFAGTGALGIEAISRGGSISYFYEINDQVYKTLIKNCNTICKSNEFYIYKKDVTQIKKIEITLPCSAIFLDPPYKFDNFDKIFDIILQSNILEKDTVLIIETDINKNLNIANKFKIINEKIYGITKILFLKKLD
tara:strand:- start:2407 stop:2976 length:570 start_codon:yes stop_codon:yes gene_type:complete